MIHVTVDVGTLPEVVAAIDQVGPMVVDIASDGLAEAGREAQDILMQNTPVRSGVAQSSWVLSVSELSVTIENDAPHINWIDEGTGVYGPIGSPIVPTAKKFLKFEKPGVPGFIYAKMVRGQKPNRITKSINLRQIGLQVSESIAVHIKASIEATVAGAAVRAAPSFFTRGSGIQDMRFRGPGGQFAKPV